MASTLWTWGTSTARSSHTTYSKVYRKYNKNMQTHSKHVGDYKKNCVEIETNVYVYVYVYIYSPIYHIYIYIYFCTYIYIYVHILAEHTKYIYMLNEYYMVNIDIVNIYLLIALWCMHTVLRT